MIHLISNTLPSNDNPDNGDDIDINLFQGLLRMATLSDQRNRRLVFQQGAQPLMRKAKYYHREIPEMLCIMQLKFEQV